MTAMLSSVWVVRDVMDVEALCRGVLRELTGARTSPDKGRKTGLTGGAGGRTSKPGQGGAVQLEPVEYDDSLSFLLAKTVELEQEFDDTRAGILFRPWLYQRLRWALIDEWRSPRMFGRHGQHRVPRGDDQVADGADADVDEVGGDAGPDLRVRGFQAVASADPADRSDADRWLYPDPDRGGASPVTGLGGGEGAGATGRDLAAGAGEAGGDGHGAAGVRRAASFDCECGWRSYRQAPNGVSRWHWPDFCAGCNRPLLGLVESGLRHGSDGLEERAPCPGCSELCHQCAGKAAA